MSGSAAAVVYACDSPQSAVRRVSVAEFGARGDGSTNDTDAFQAALDALGSAGGTVDVADGIYMIDAVRGVALRNGVTLMLARGAVLRAIPNAAPASAVLVATDRRDITINGGAIEGERSSHLGTSGQWGMGIRLSGCSNVVVYDVAIRDCWGDAVYIGKGTGPCSGVTITGCTMDNNRRQGISIVACTSAVISRCIISNTHGIDPQSGIDLEPNPGDSVSNVRIEDCTLSQNAGCGIQLYGTRISSSVLLNNECAGNGRTGVWLHDSASNELRSNHITLNHEHGILLNGAADHNVVAVNSCDGNSQGGNAQFDNIHLDDHASSNWLEGNTCRAGAGANQPRYGIRVNAASCVGNSLIRNDVTNSGSVAEISDVGTATVIVHI